MPRQRKTMSGDPAQSTRTGAPGVRYGEGQDLAEMRQAAPIPNARAGGSSPSPAPPALQPGLPAEASMPPTPAPAMPKPGLLLAPSGRPNEPVTAGLSHGPGAGPEVLNAAPMESPTGKLLRDLARITGREYFNDLARRSRL